MDTETEDAPTVASKGASLRARPPAPSGETRLEAAEATRSEALKSANTTDPSSAHARLARPQATVASPADAERQDERVHDRLLALTGITVSTAAVLGAPLLPGSIAAHTMLAVSLATIIAGASAG